MTKGSTFDRFRRRSRPLPPKSPRGNPASHPQIKRSPPSQVSSRDRRLKTININAQASRFRLALVGGILLVGVLGLCLNLFRLQILQGRELRELAKSQQQTTMRPFVPRRPIIDRNGNALAIDQQVYTLYAHPKLFKKTPEAIASQIGPILGLTVTDLVKQFQTRDSGIRIEFSLPENLANRIANLYLDGLELVPEQQRIYPHQEIGAEVVGYVNLDRKGQAGLEYSQQNILERAVPEISFTLSSLGAWIPDQMPGGFLHLDDLRLQLTIDHRLQRAARNALKQQMQLFHAKRGTVIVMDAKDGSLLSLVCEPTYDPNYYFQVKNAENFKNWALSDTYEPGSTFKPINVAIALEAGKIKPDSVFNDEGQIYIDGWPIQNYDFDYAGGHGPLSVTDIIKYSSNVGMVHIVQTLKPEIYHDWLERLGLGQTSGIDLPFEAPSQLKSREQYQGSHIDAATTAFGQGVALTPIQMAQLHATLANGGKLVTPHVVQGLFDSEGQLYWQPNLPAPRQVFSQKNTQAVLEMMEKVVTEGTGKPAQIPGYRIAGKTGTAQKANNDTGGYSDYAKITSFVGIFPINSPRYVVLAVVDEPQGGAGATVAAPVVKSVMEALIGLEKIIPSQKIKE